MLEFRKPTEDEIAYVKTFSFPTTMSFVRLCLIALIISICYYTLTFYLLFDVALYPATVANRTKLLISAICLFVFDVAMLCIEHFNKHNLLRALKTGEFQIARGIYDGACVTSQGYQIRNFSKLSHKPIAPYSEVCLCKNASRIAVIPIIEDL